MMGRNCLKTDATSIGLISATSAAVAVLAAAAVAIVIHTQGSDQEPQLRPR